jgi:poly-gamma-glutamate synthesis protein (capsule biosynthesis protein)
MSTSTILWRNYLGKFSTALLIFLTQGCTQIPVANNDPADVVVPVNRAVDTVAQPKSYTTEATLMAVGDIMMHGSQIKSGFNSQTKSYDFQVFFNDVKSIISQADWAIANLETPLAGASAKYTGYPMFNAPAELADAIKSAGFNILTTTNNHSLDRGEKGVLKTLEHLQARDLLAVGTANSVANANKILMVEKEQIKMAILAYTYGTNGIPIPKGKNYLVSLINEPQIVKDILRARKEGADIVTVALHFGTEYQRQPNQEQKKLVSQLVKAGADIILGSHPHVVQPYEIFELTGEKGKKRKAVAIYSMGNFISGQRGNYKDLGVIFQVNLEKQFPDKTVTITDVKTIPTWVQRYTDNGKMQYRVLPIAEVLEKRKDKFLTATDYSKLEKYLSSMERHLKPQELQANKK